MKLPWQKDRVATRAGSDIHGPDELAIMQAGVTGSALESQPCDDERALAVAREANMAEAKKLLKED